MEYPGDRPSTDGSGSTPQPPSPADGDAEVLQPPPRRRGRAHAPDPAADRSFSRTLLLTVAGAVVPGLGLIAARRRVMGSIVLGVFVSGLVVLGVWVAADPQGVRAMAVQPSMLIGLSVALVAIALGWVVVIVVSHLSLRGPSSRLQRAVGGALVGVLAFVVAAPMAVAARYSYDQASLVNQVFKSEKQTKSATRPTWNPAPAQPSEPGRPEPTRDPWAGKARLNVLLLGGDAGRGRIGTRTDTVIVASIDTKTGNTTLISLPRNTARMPFPSDSPLHRYYPSGFTNGDGNNAEYFLNAMYENVPNTVPKDVLGETDNLGADVLKLSVGQAVGLELDYYVLINLKGFERLVNALGGITVNVNTYVPIGGNSDLHVAPTEYISPGPDQHLNGRSALWFARGRYGSDDFARMDRQRCVINAIIKQANPANMLARYEQIAKAGKEIVKTDMPQEVLPAMVDLSLRVKDGNVRSVVFKYGVAGFYSNNPDFSMMRKRVKVALGETKEDPPKKSKKKKGSSSAGTSTAQSDNIEDSCAYDAAAAARATRPR